MTRRDLIRALYLHGRTSEQIAAAVGLTTCRVERILDQQATKSRTRKYRHTPALGRIDPDRLFSALMLTANSS